MTGLEMFAIVGGFLTVCLAIFWTVVAAGTVAGAWRGTLFVAPCLKGSAGQGSAGEAYGCPSGL